MITVKKGLLLFVLLSASASFGCDLFTDKSTQTFTQTEATPEPTPDPQKVMEERAVKLAQYIMKNSTKKTGLDVANETAARIKREAEEDPRMEYKPEWIAKPLPTNDMKYEVHFSPMPGARLRFDSWIVDFTTEKVFWLGEGMVEDNETFKAVEARMPH